MDMNRMIHAKREAERFLAAVNALWVRRTEAELAHDPDPLDGSIQSGAVRRASLDLTRALAEMRKP